MTNQWTWWRAALDGSIGPIMESKPESGYYRHFIGAGVAIWRDGENILMLLDGAPIDDHVQQGKVWLQVARNPVRFADYDARMKNGSWPSSLPEVPTVAQKTEDTPAAERGPGDNSGDLDEYQRMRAEILGDADEAAAWLHRTKIATKPDADKAHDWGQRLSKAAKSADKARLAANEPLRRQIEENDKKWHAIIGPARERSAVLIKAAEDFGKAEVARIQKEQAEAARKKWEAEQAELKRKREEEAAARAAAAAAQGEQPDADGVLPPEPVQELPLAPPPPPVAPPPKLMLGTGTEGNRRSVRTKAPETATIVDLAAAAQFFAAQQHPELVALIQKLADRAIKARAKVPGIRFSWEQPATEAAE